MLINFMGSYLNIDYPVKNMVKKLLTRINESLFTENGEREPLGMRLLKGTLYVGMTATALAMAVVVCEVGYLTIKGDLTQPPQTQESTTDQEKSSQPPQDPIMNLPEDYPILEHLYR